MSSIDPLISKVTSSRRPSRRRLLLVAGSVLLLLFAIAGIYSTLNRHSSQDMQTDVGTEPVEPAPVDQDTQFRRLVVGTWEDDFEGKRTMCLKDDGTGTMIVELSGLKALLAASKLRFDMTWTVENGRLKKRTVGGEPANTVQMILKTMGDRVDEPILELTKERLLLLDKDGTTKYDWKRKAGTP